jgi:hypothetical protein
MLDKTASAKALRRFFRRFLVADLAALLALLQTSSRMSVFRRLREQGYHSSFTHAGRYYTLGDIPEFDEQGLWFRQGIGFSRSGTLKATVVHLTETAASGYTHAELEQVLRLRVHNTLLGLFQQGRLGRERLEKTYLYVSARPRRAEEQVGARQQLLAEEPATAPLPAATVIEVLVEALTAGRVTIAPSVVAQRLGARGVAVTGAQVEQVFAQYGVSTGKKTARSDLPRSRG